MIRLFRRGSDQGQSSQAVHRSNGFVVTRRNMADVYRRAMWVCSHPAVDENDKPYLRAVAGLAGGAAIFLKYGQRREMEDELRSATREWQTWGAKYERVAYPERFPADPSEGTGIDEIDGHSITRLRAADPIELLPFAMNLRNFGDYPEEAHKWLDDAISAFRSANKPPSRHMGENWMMLDIGVLDLIRAEKARLGMA